MKRKLLIIDRTAEKTRKLLLLSGLALLPAIGFAQTCTITGTSPIGWNNTTRPTCQEGGTAPAPGATGVIIIPTGVTLVFDDNADTWTGLRIEVNGTLSITANVTINADITVNGTGTLAIGGKLELGTSAGCGYDLVVQPGGKVDIVGGVDDRLFICGVRIAQGNPPGGGSGGCFPYPGTQLPFCEPTGGFTGPFSFDERGLPVSWINFNVEVENKVVNARWSTSTEKNAHYFVLERSMDGINFEEVNKVPAIGESVTRQDYRSTDKAPLIGRSYYRLKQVDLDGTTDYYPKIITIQYSGPKKVIVHPNPVSSPDKFTVELNFSTEQTSYLSITDLMGKEVFAAPFAGLSFQPQVKLNTGTYILKVKSGTEVLVTRFSVK